MSLIEAAFSFFSIFITNVFFIFMYKKSVSNDIKYNKYLVYFLASVCSIFIILNNLYISGFFREIITITLYYLIYHLIFKEDWKICLIKTILIYIIYMLLEIIFALIAMLISPSWDEFNQLYIIKSLFTIIVSVMELFVFKSNIINNMIININKNIKLQEKIITSLILLLISVSILTFAPISKFSTTDMLMSVILIIVFIILSITIFKELRDLKQAEEKEEILLNFINKYEKLLDSNRINRHEMLNNLIILNSYKNKNTASYQKILNEIIEKYQNNESRNVSALYNLPSGLKGMLYYKINSIEKNKLLYNITISKNSNKALNNLDSKIYYNVCKCVGILMDNAIESATNTDEKMIIIDIYEEKKKIVIYIENSCLESIVKSNIQNKGVSTKGKHRGYGLYILNEIIRENNVLGIEQTIKNKRFISMLTIDTSSQNKKPIKINL